MTNPHREASAELAAEQARFLSYLHTDLAEKNAVKLDLKTEPYELTGHIRDVIGDMFMMEDSPYVYSVSCIRHYRLG